MRCNARRSRRSGMGREREMGAGREGRDRGKGKESIETLGEILNLQIDSLIPPDPARSPDTVELGNSVPTSSPFTPATDRDPHISFPCPSLLHPLPPPLSRDI